MCEACRGRKITYLNPPKFVEFDFNCSVDFIENKRELIAESMGFFYQEWGNKMVANDSR